MSRDSKLNELQGVYQSLNANGIPLHENGDSIVYIYANYAAYKCFLEDENNTDFSIPCGGYMNESIHAFDTREEAISSLDRAAKHAVACEVWNSKKRIEILNASEEDLDNIVLTDYPVFSF